MAYSGLPYIERSTCICSSLFAGDLVKDVYSGRKHDAHVELWREPLVLHTRIGLKMSNGRLIFSHQELENTLGVPPAGRDMTAGSRARKNVPEPWYEGDWHPEPFASMLAADVSASHRASSAGPAAENQGMPKSAAARSNAAIAAGEMPFQSPSQQTRKMSTGEDQLRPEKGRAVNTSAEVSDPAAAAGSPPNGMVSAGTATGGALIPEQQSSALRSMSAPARQGPAKRAELDKDNNEEEAEFKALMELDELLSKLERHALEMPRQSGRPIEQPELWEPTSILQNTGLKQQHCNGLVTQQSAVHRESIRERNGKMSRRQGPVSSGACSESAPLGKPAVLESGVPGEFPADSHHTAVAVSAPAVSAAACNKAAQQQIHDKVEGNSRGGGSTFADPLVSSAAVSDGKLIATSANSSFGCQGSETDQNSNQKQLRRGASPHEALLTAATMGKSVSNHLLNIWQNAGGLYASSSQACTQAQGVSREQQADYQQKKLSHSSSESFWDDVGISTDGLQHPALKGGSPSQTNHVPVVSIALYDSAAMIPSSFFFLPCQYSAG